MKVAYLGSGKMAESIVKGVILKSKKWAHFFYSPNGISAEKLALKYNGQSINNLQEINDMDLVIIACKPQQWSQLKDSLLTLKWKEKKPQFISLMAAVTISKINLYFPCVPWTRVMPNTPCAEALGISLLYSNSSSIPSIVDEYFKTCSLTVPLQNEEEFDRLTVLTGSGPGYLFYLFSIFEKFLSSQSSIDDKKSREIVTQLFLGATILGQKSGESFLTLMDNVCSKGGVTLEGIKHFQEKNLENIFEEAFEKAYQRGRTLAKELT